ncbi:MAG: hypothetical protein JWN13_3431 [Betaproteobacteria bacterium]|nr:hypothetical protein [Betaproteobacteria bacterium]
MSRSRRISLALLSAALICGTVESRASEQSLKRIDAVPPLLEGQFAQAIRAWQSFTVEDEKLAGALLRALNRKDDRSGVTPLADASLHRYLYPWATLEDTPRSGRSAEPRGAPPSRPDGSEKVVFRIAGSETLTIRYDYTMPFVDAVAGVGRRTGRWYWEVFHHPAATLSEVPPEVGVDTPYASHPFIRMPEQIRRMLLGGEVLQFALDTDSQKLDIGIDGQWVASQRLKGRPRASGAAGSYVPAAHVAPTRKVPHGSDLFTFNFGASSFRYPLPDGYEPYDLTARAARLAEAGNMPVHTQPIKLSRYDEPIRSKMRSTVVGTSPALRSALTTAVETWMAYRNAACRLTAEYLRLDEPPAVRSEPHAGCVADFTGSMVNRLEELAAMLARAQPPIR